MTKPEWVGLIGHRVAPLYSLGYIKKAKLTGNVCQECSMVGILLAERRKVLAYCIHMGEKDSGLNFILEMYAVPLEEWIREHGPSAMRQELQLDADTTASALWRSGYLQALQHLQCLIREQDSGNTCTQQGNSELFH